MKPFDQPTFDYDKQAWIQNGVYLRCGHQDSMQCDCYGRLHAGEPAQPIGETPAAPAKSDPAGSSDHDKLVQYANAAAEIITAVAETIRQAGSIPSGHIYAHIMDKINLEDWHKIVALLERTGLIRQDRSFLLHWVGGRTAPAPKKRGRGRGFSETAHYEGY